MSQQNIWKKQMLANKNKLNDSKVEVKAPEQANQPPWVKNNVNNTPALNNFKNTNSETASNQPSWMKNAVNPAQNTAIKTNVEAPKAPINSTPPWAKQNQEQSSPSAPPWAKQNKQATSSSPPPPWANKGSTQAPKVANQTTPSNPPWAKSNNIIPVQSPPAPWAKPANTVQSSTPAWANKNSGINQPAWANKAQSAPNPPWMKKEDSSVQGGNSWKLKQMADVEKEKKQREQKMRQQQEQQKQAKRIQKLRREKQQQQANIKRQLQAMEKQQQISKKRQKFDKDQIERIQREKKERLERQQKEKLQKLRFEEQQKLRRQKQEKEKQQAEQKERERVRIQQQERLQRQRLQLQRFQNSKTKSKSTKKNKKFQLQTSKISHISSIRGAQALHSSSINAFQSMSPRERDPNQPQNLFHRYTRLMNQQSSQTDYRNKVCIQKLIIETQLSFKRQCETEIIGLVQKKKITNRKRKIVFSNNMQIRYGLCQGKKGDNGLQFVKDEAQSLRATFLHYQMLTNSIITLLKKKVNIHLRVPLINYAQYKGINFLIEYICEELVDIIQIDVGLFQQISNQILILEKQLQLLYQGKNLKPLTKNQLMVKKINVYGYDYYILYIKQDDFKSKKLSNSPIKSSKGQPQNLNLSYLKFIEDVSSQSVMLPFYSSLLQLSEKTWQFYEKTGSASMKSLLKDIFLANSINTVYNSCQGEVEQNIFFDLVIEGNKQIWDMIKSAGFKDKINLTPISLAYLQKLSSVRFDFNSSLFSKKRKNIIQSVNPQVYIQRHEFEMIDFMKNLDKYILQDKEDLVQQSYKMNRQVWDQISKSADNIKSHGVNLYQIKQNVNYLLYKRRQLEAIDLLQRQEEKLSLYALERVSISLLFIKIFVQMDSQVRLLKKLSELLQILQFYFKQQIILHSYVYTIVGNYYSKKSEDETRQSKVITFYQHAIDIAIKIYGEKAVQVAEVYLSRANAMFNLNKKEAFQKDVALALKIYKGHSKNNSKIAQCIYLIGKAGCTEGKNNEGIQSLQSSRNLYLKLQNYVQALNVSFQLLRFLELDQSKYEAEIQKIIQICFRYKSIWAFKKIIALLINRQLQCYTTFTLTILEDLFVGDQQDRTNEEILIDLQQQIKGFTSFIEIVRWSLSILAAKTITRKQTSTDYEKAFNIMRQVMHFYKANLPPQVISQMQ